MKDKSWHFYLPAMIFYIYNRTFANYSFACFGNGKIGQYFYTNNSYSCTI